MPEITTKTYHRKDGALIFEARTVNTQREMEEAGDLADWRLREMLGGLSQHLGHDLAEGDVVMVARHEYVGPNLQGGTWGVAPDSILIRPDNGEGWPGNSDHQVTRYHGWRGTTQDWAVIADGLREVKSIAITGQMAKRLRIVFGPDKAIDLD